GLGGGGDWVSPVAGRPRSSPPGSPSDVPGPAASPTPARRPPAAGPGVPPRAGSTQPFHRGSGLGPARGLLRYQLGRRGGRDGRGARPAESDHGDDDAGRGERDGDGQAGVVAVKKSTGRRQAVVQRGTLA